MRTGRRLVDADSEKTLVPRLEETETRLEATVGLLGRKGLAPGAGLLIRGCGSIHTLFMRFSIDAVYLGEELRVLRVRARLSPWRASVCRGAAHVLELPAGAAREAGLEAGMRLEVRDRPDAPPGDLP
jgi:uncharacterized protein